MKQFHRMILRMLPGPMVAWLGVLMFLLVMQFLIKYLPQLVGKGLPFLIIFELIVYNLAYMLVLAVPMAALIATLMAFGRLAESNAYVVIKGSGVSFPQLAWPVYLAGILLTGVMWIFNTQIHPEANFRARNLWQDIRVAKPGFDLQAGVFYDGIEDYKILVGEIPENDTNALNDITIFDYSEGARFRTDIRAAFGRLEPMRNGSTLNLMLFDGEIHRRRPPGSGNTDRYEKLAFDRHLLRISLEDLNFQRSDPTEGRRTDRTMKTSEMKALVDSLELTATDQSARIKLIMASLGTGSVTRDEVGTLIPDETRPVLLSRVEGSGTSVVAQSGDTSIKTIRNVRVKIDSARRSILWAQGRADRYRVEIHKKYSIALACLIFMMIGAPLGLSVRRGGLGTSAALAVAIFLFHWVSLANGEKLADRGLMEPWFGMWIADIITGGIAIYLTFFVWKDLRAIPDFSIPSFSRKTAPPSDTP
ncbi:MAG: YjgP/YjgQ family permease [Bacteroidetes Order II. Incertae sedis bacterium]|jgi:lipopolysaccharide export system permease protein|nr:YjgP/YjgQ family permease [Bacteroidetes Order II. bacterium]MDG1753406.1 LptF/LptG family permease [Rhodothermales bacterium]MBT4051913.1 YjgP/YjgQ family permease [Bacteroidetes Order II. bacterium]MBT5250655.1 YjgP/YjgQ family permease [Bacteroidetes Order II. bacterium]MBT6425748.1 YjgP/YjgQ family permease [Bacteroidetes Order II. bacterium]